MTKAELIRYIRNSVSVKNVDVDGVMVVDSAYLKMTDDDIELFLKVALTRDFPEASIDFLLNEYVYPVTLLTQKELFVALSVASAPLFDLSADNNNSLKRSDRFKHYSSLITLLNAEYNQYTKDGGVGTKNTLTSYDVTLSNRYATQRNYEKGLVPTLSLYTEVVKANSVELFWSVRNCSRFLSYQVYVSQDIILDQYAETPISEGAKLVLTQKDIWKTKCRVEGLLPNTNYHFLVVVTDMAQHKAYQEIVVTTLVTDDVVVEV